MHGELTVFLGSRPTGENRLVLERHGTAPVPSDGRYGRTARRLTVWRDPNCRACETIHGPAVSQRSPQRPALHRQKG